MSVETASILSFATNGALAPAKLAVPFSTPTLTLPQALSAAAAAPDDRAQQAISAVKQANANWRGLRKSMAGFRLQYAQAALKALMFFGGDPVQIAKRAAQLAREVRAAAQEYTAAGGDAADVAAAQSAAADISGTAATPAPTVATAVVPSGPNSFANDAKATLDALKAVVARNRHPVKDGRQHHQAVAAFDDAASSADAAVGQASGLTLDSLNLLI